MANVAKTTTTIAAAVSESLDIIPFDHRVGVAAADLLQFVARIGDPSVRPYISCDGFLVILIGQQHLCIVNPATRQFAGLPSLISIRTHHVGRYPHSPTGEYRILLAPDDPDDSYQVYTLGSSEPPMHIDIEGPYVEDLSPSTPLMFRGSLHWCIGNIIHVFNTTTESFRQMLAPDVPDSVDRYVIDILYGAVLFEMDGMLSMPILTDEFTSIGI
uniref:F-box associated beta-propeller type 1 domain-containing protein n=1 Tax=Aegilops tauschii TaxID=37682 RepID=R7WA16_AEGTA